MGGAKMKNRYILLIGSLIAITVVGAGLRLYKLSSAPPAMNWDEASYGYNAYSLWKTGKDEYGTTLPTSIRSFDDYKPPLYAYATAPIVGIFGLNELNTRLVSAISGILTILVTFALASRLLKSTKAGLIAAAVVATSPWSAHYSRLAFEAVPALLLLLISWWYLLKGEKDKQKYVYALGFATLSYFSYNSHKIYWLVVAGWIAWKIRKEIFKEIKLIFKLALVCLPIGYSVIFGNTLARFSSTSIFPLYKETHSVYLFAGEFINRYSAYFSPANVFVRGTNEPNQKVFDLAVFYPFEVVFFGLGVWWLIKKRSKYIFIVCMLLLAPIPAALTWSWFTPIRVLPLWWLISLIIGKGVWETVVKLTKKWQVGLVILVGGWWILSIGWYLMAEVWYMPYTDYGQWQWGFREAIAAIQPYKNKYKYVVWETPQAQPHIFTLFYSKFPPAEYQFYLTNHPVQIPRTNFDIPGFYYRKIFWPTDKDLKDVLFIGTVYSLPENDLKRDGIKIMQDIIDPQGYVTYRIAGF